MSATPPSTLDALATITGLTWRRLWRGRSLWVSVAIAALPIVYALLATTEPHLAERLFSTTFLVELLLLAVLPPLFVAASIGEEIEDRTATYLWSRPIGRGVIVAGKLLALAPVAAALLVLGWLLAIRVGAGTFPTLRSAGALALGGLSSAAVAAGIALLAPRYGMALATSYLLFFDLPVGELPVSIRFLSLSHHTLTLAGMSGDGSRGALIGLVVVGAAWLAAGLYRLRRLET
jgi:ABC-type transport system involved in multi-copper enzyme maturation permease subunit